MIAPPNRDLARARSLLAAVLASSAGAIPEFLAERDDPVTVSAAENTLVHLGVALSRLKVTIKQSMQLINRRFDVSLSAGSHAPDGFTEASHPLDGHDQAAILLAMTVGMFEAVLAPLYPDRPWQYGNPSLPRFFRVDFRVFSASILQVIAACFSAREAIFMIQAGDDIWDAPDNPFWSPLREALLFGPVAIGDPRALLDMLHHEMPLAGNSGVPIPDYVRPDEIMQDCTLPQRAELVADLLGEQAALAAGVREWRRRINAAPALRGRDHGADNTLGVDVAAPDPKTLIVMADLYREYARCFSESQDGDGDDDGTAHCENDGQEGFDGPPEV